MHKTCCSVSTGSRYKARFPDAQQGTQGLLPIKGKSDWSSSWIPVVGPLAGGGLAGLVAAAAPIVFTAAP
jgi:hypothetical protein